MTGRQAEDLMRAVLDRLGPHLPAGIHVQVTCHAKWITLQRAVVSYHPPGDSAGRVTLAPFPVNLFG
jgi:hypothetical protein